MSRTISIRAKDTCAVCGHNDLTHSVLIRAMSTSGGEHCGSHACTCTGFVRAPKPTKQPRRKPATPGGADGR